MRITIMCPAHSWGDERVVCRQALTLARSGHDVLVLGREDPGKQPPRHPQLTLQSVGGMTRGASLRSRFSRILALRACHRAAMAGAPDLIAAHEPETALLALYVGWRRNIPVHFDVHECFDELLASRAPRLLAGGVKRLAWRVLAWIARRCDYVSVVSPVTQRQYQAVRPGRRTDLIHNSPPAELFPICDHDPKGLLTICHEGWLDATRGMDPLLRAVALAGRQEPIQLLVVGKVGAGSAAEFDRLVAELALADRVKVTGWLPYAEVGQVDATAQIGVVTLQPSGNNYGSLSNKVYSYMACGQAVIVPQGSATEELVAKYDCGLAVDVTRPEAIAQAILQLHADPVLRQSMGRNGRRAIEQDLGWHVMSARLLTAYEDGRPDRPPPGENE
jgi:glycosyltransferase involved in cell wall biosynthesis